MVFDGFELLVSAIIGGLVVALVIGRGISDLRASFAELRRENTRLQCRVEVLERENTTKDKMIADLRADLIIWQARYTDLESKLPKAKGAA